MQKPTTELFYSQLYTHHLYFIVHISNLIYSPKHNWFPPLRIHHVFTISRDAFPSTQPHSDDKTENLIILCAFIPDTSIL